MGDIRGLILEKKINYMGIKLNVMLEKWVKKKTTKTDHHKTQSIILYDNTECEIKKLKYYSK